MTSFKTLIIRIKTYCCRNSKKILWILTALTAIATILDISFKAIWSDEKPKQETIVKETNTLNVSTSEKNSPAVVSNGDVTINYGDTTEKKDSIKADKE